MHLCLEACLPLIFGVCSLLQRLMNLYTARQLWLAVAAWVFSFAYAFDRVPYLSLCFLKEFQRSIVSICVEFLSVLVGRRGICTLRHVFACVYFSV